MQDGKGGACWVQELDNDATMFHPSDLAERRVRLAIGLKRYFHGKRMEGLLSTGVHTSVHPTHCLLHAHVDVVYESVHV